MSKRRRITIELTKMDERHIESIQDVTGEPTIIGAIRYALREADQVSQSVKRPKALDELTEQAQRMCMDYE